MMDSALTNTQSLSTVPTKECDLSTTRSPPYLTASAAEAHASAGAAEPAPNALKKEISTRAFCVLAVSGSIGAGLLVASGSALARGGPGSLVVAFAVVGFMVWMAMLALGELSASFPVQGSFYDFSVRFISESWGFAMGWNYVLNFALIVAFEMTVMMMIAELWVPGHLGPVESGLLSLVPVCMLLLAGIQAFGAKGYGEAERAFGLLKVSVLFIFVVTGIVIASGGTKEAGGRGFENWQSGQAFLNGIPGFLSVFVAAGMAYGGTEMIGLTVAECKHPRKVMPLGAMIVIGRILLCYLLPLVIVGFVLAPSALQLPPFARLHAVSPFVVAVEVAGIPKLGHVINAILLVSVFSMANASVFATSRAMVSICKKGMGPRALGEVTRRGIPRNALFVVFAVAQLAWIGFAPKGQVIFDWLLSVASVSNYFTWTSICVCHVRMRSAMRKQGRSSDELTWKSPLGVYGSYIAIAINLICMGVQIASAILPPVNAQDTSRIQNLFMGILGFIFVSLLYLGHILFAARKYKNTSWREKLWIPSEELSLPELDASRSGEESAVRSGEK